MDRKHVIVATPAAPLSPNLAIAACRAGAVGVLDVSYWPPDDAAARHHLGVLQRRARGFGVLLDHEAAAWIDSLADCGGLRAIVLTEAAWTADHGLVERARQPGRDVYLQLQSLRHAEEAAELSPSGVILKGHESGGMIGGETAFVLLQRWQDKMGDSSLPVHVQGGVGLHTAAACAAGGAAGVVYDCQLLLTRESPLDAAQRQWLAAADGSESRVVGQELGWPVRFLAPPRCAALEKLQAEAQRLKEAGCQDRGQWLAAIREAIAGGAYPWGQDAGVAKQLAAGRHTVGGVIEAAAGQVRDSLRLAADHQPLAPDAPLAASHGTQFPLLQGPMTRVSDVAPFADAVAGAGGLPFLALALLRGPQVEDLLQETKERLDGRPWGVGLLGFLPADIRKEQMEAVSLHRPPFALIAGGRPDQAQVLEKQGIPTYLHVPSPGLLRMFLKDGARRFVFEGRECGGHVGPRSSFVLWETMCQLLLDHLATPKGRGDAEQLHVVFAGGIHDGRSAAMVAALAAPLAARGVKIGALMGTAYLFTREAVDSGAIVPRFQREAIEAAETVLLETGPGHAIRCIPTPYFDVFEREKRRLLAEGKSHEELVKALEWMNIGRLRVASKGVDRVDDDGGGRRLAEVDEDEQFQRGMYMIGQVSSMRRDVITMRELHSQVCEGAVRLLEQARPRPLPAPPASPCDVAVIGMASFYPGSTSLQQYWENILNSVYCVTEVPPGHWDWRLFYDPDPAAPDRIISKWGGFLPDVPFDPFRYGITPNSISSIEPLQLLLLECVRRSLEDAGYADRSFDHENTCAILGIGGGGAPKGVLYGLRSCMPLLNTIEGLGTSGERVIELAEDQLPTWTEDSFPGTLLNVAVGRTANRFNLGGSNYAIDAACASSLAAVHACVRELQMGTANVALALGADTVNTAYSFVAFSKTHALSPRGRCRPFDEEADGIVLSEGIGAVVLKRLEDAERDGDEIYAVIRGAGSSSDGKDKGLTAPNAAGQLRALRRAYQAAGISPASVELIEAHGTGTVVGDQTEATSLTTVMREAGAAQQSCALGSVKSMIGHSKCAAGIGGLIKTVKALHHRALPPTMAETPNKRAKFNEGALYLNTEPRPWIHATDSPRVAGVSAFGFGGTNVHVALEEYVDGYLDEPPPALQNWPAELLVWRAADTQQLAQSMGKTLEKLRAGAKPQLAQLAASLWRVCPRDPALPTAAVVAESLEDLVAKLDSAVAAVQSGETSLRDPRGAYFAAAPADEAGKVAFLFPGQGAQYPDMLAEAAMNFHEVRSALDEACTVLQDVWDRPLGRWIYPPSAFSDEDRRRRESDLAATDVAQPAIGAASLGMLRLLRSLGVEADCYAGHSYGELTALCAAGAIDPASLLRLSLARGRLMKQAAAAEAGGMAAVSAGADRVASLIEGLESVWIANFNSPQQTVVSGDEAGLKQLEQRAAEAKVKARRLPVSCAFHSPLIEEAAEPFAAELRTADWQPPAKPVYSNVTAAPYDPDPPRLLEQLSGHLRCGVRFQEQIERMYADGARTFVEVGPNQVLSTLVARILDGRPHVALASDSKARRGLVQLPHLLGQLLAAGVPAQLDSLFTRRRTRTFDVGKLERETGEPQLAPSTWLVNGTRSKPLNAPEPRLLGQGGLGGESSDASGGQPAAGQPAAGKPAAGQPAAGKPAAGKPAAGKPAAGKPAAGKPASAKPASAKPASTAAASQPSAGGQPTSEPAGKPADQQPRRSGAASAAQPSAPPRPAALPPQPAASASSSPSGAAAHASHATSSSYAQNGMKNQQASRLPASQSQHSPDDAVQVMLGFQDVMARFLDTQRAVMAAYLGGEEVGQQPAPRLAGSLPATVAPPTPASEAEGRAAAAPPAAGGQPARAADATGGNGAPDGNGASGGNGNGADPYAAAAKAPAPASPEPAEQTDEAAAEHLPADDEVQAGDELQAADADAALPDGLEKSLEEIGEDLLDLVSERTGYPKDMLDLDLDLEADLGIDSIKRVEILGGLAESLGEAPQEDGEYEGRLELERLTTIRTLRGILEYLEEVLFGDAALEAGAAAGSSSPAAADAGRGGPDDDPRAIHRGLVELVEAPIASGSSPMIPRGAVLITDDGGGVSAELADRMGDFGQKVVLLRDAPGAGVSWSGDVCTADLACERAVAQLVAEARQKKSSLAGLIHAAPLAAGDDAAARLRDVKCLYVLARALEDDLRQASQQGGAFLLACCKLDGKLGYGDDKLSSVAAACHGGVPGLLKCLLHEWPDVLVRAVDFPDGGAAADRAERLLGELGDREGPAEVGWHDGVRRTWRPVDAPLDEDAPAAELPAGGVILVTGGARGITAAIARQLSARCRPRLVVVGRSPLPGDEPPETAGLDGAADIKAAIMQQLKDEGQDVAPAAVEARYQRLLADREIRGNLAALREAAAEAEYHSVDVRDEPAMRRLLEDVAGRLGPVQGVIHGAGVIEDKLLRDKTPESYDRVVGTKADSALILARLLDPQPLKFCVFFSSIAGRYGNRGQSDYAAANEILAKLAIDLDRRWPARVLAVDWGPWAGLGMVADLEKHMTARGVALITPEVGAEMLVNELLHGRKGESEVMIAGGASNLHSPRPATV